MKKLINFTTHVGELEFTGNALLDSEEDETEYFVNLYGQDEDGTPEGSQLSLDEYEYENGVTVEVGRDHLITNDLANQMIKIGVI